jgi:transposase
MISFNRLTKVFICKTPVDMRASYDTLFGKVKDVLHQDPYTGHLFVFINKHRTLVKCLFWDGTGLVLLCKRLNQGLFYKINPLHQGDVILSPAEFALFFEGADLEKRFIESPREVKKTFPMRQQLQRKESSATV